MLIIHAGQMPCSENVLRQALTEYRDLLEWHKTTEGVPAPWPDHEILREIVAGGGEFTVIYPPPPSSKELALRALAEKRAAEAEVAQDRLLAEEALKPDAPQEVKDYVAANPSVAALATPATESKPEQL